MFILAFSCFLIADILSVRAPTSSLSLPSLKTKNGAPKATPLTHPPHALPIFHSYTLRLLYLFSSSYLPPASTHPQSQSILVLAPSPPPFLPPPPTASTPPSPQSPSRSPPPPPLPPFSGKYSRCPPSPAHPPAARTPSLPALPSPADSPE